MRTQRTGGVSSDPETPSNCVTAYWLGGGSGAAKSTVAARQASTHRMLVLACDDVMSERALELSPEDAPSLASFMAMDIDERWLSHTPETMLESIGAKAFGCLSTT